MYNFYLYLFIFSIFNPLSIFLKKDILKSLAITEEILLSSLVINTAALIYYIYVDKKNIFSLLEKIFENKNFVIDKLIIYDLMILTILYLSGYILIKEKIVYGESFKTACFLLIIGIITCISGNINIFTVVGLLSIILGIYFIEKGKN
tara:strand:+ start:75 stop:518 length:444 start_codon:yes stop_codon:yes gene_type:complete